MTRVKPVLFFVLVFLVVFPYRVAAQNAEQGPILVINSQRESLLISDCIVKAVLHGLPEAYKATGVITDNMNILQISTEQQLDSLTRQLLRDYKTPPSLIVMESNCCWELLHEAIEEQWGDIPIILCYSYKRMGTRDNFLKKTAITSDAPLVVDAVKGKNVALIPILNYPSQTVELMKQLIPQMDTLVFISDQRYVNAQSRYDLRRKMQKKYPQIYMKDYIEGEITTDNLIDSIQQASDNTGFLFASWYSPTHGYDRHYVLGYRIIARNAGRAIFCLNDGITQETDMIGGCMQSFADIDKAISGAVSQILNGKPAREVGVVDVPPRMVIDYQPAKEYGLVLSNIPGNALLYRAPESFWMRFRIEIICIFTLVLAVLTLIGMRLYMSNKVRRAQGQELDSMHKYNQLFQKMPIPFMSCILDRDDEGKVQGYWVDRVNPAFEKNFYTLDLRQPLRCGSVWGKESPRLKQFLERMTLCDKKQEPMAFHVMHPDTVRHYRKILIPDGAEKMNVYYMEYTEVFEAQQELQSLYHKMALSLEMSNLVSWKWKLDKWTIECDARRSLKTINDPVAPVVFSTEAFISRIHPDYRNRVEDRFQDLVDGKIELFSEVYLGHHLLDGGSYPEYDWIETKASVFRRDERGKPISLVGSSMVITEQKRLEQALIGARDMAQNSDRLKSAFLANMSHEIRTPLNAIVGFSGIMAVTESEEERMEYAHIIESNNELLLQLISDVLDLAKIEAGALDFEYSTVDVGHLVHDVVQAALFKGQHTGLKIVLEQGEPHCVIYTERNRVLQVINNFVTNAFKFTKEGSIRIGYQRRGNRVRFYVSDTGCGIPKKDQKNVFGRFVKLNNFVQGTGLGLSICDTIVRRMGGEIGVESEQGVGSTFWFTIPYEPAEMPYTN